MGEAVRCPWGKAQRPGGRHAAGHDETTAGDGVITLRGLTKRYGEVLAVDDLTVDVEPGG